MISLITSSTTDPELINMYTFTSLDFYLFDFKYQYTENVVSDMINVVYMLINSGSVVELVIYLIIALVNYVIRN
jgi:hypothetical protein